MYYMGQVAAVVSCDKVNKEYQVLALRWCASKGESGTKGFMPGLTHPPIPLRFIFYFRLKLNTFYVYAQEERAFQSLWNLLKLKYSHTSCTNYTACTLRRKYTVWKLQFLVFSLSMGDIYWERVTFKILKIAFKVSQNCTGTYNQLTILINVLRCGQK